MNMYLTLFTLFFMRVYITMLLYKHKNRMKINHIRLILKSIKITIFYTIGFIFVIGPVLIYHLSKSILKALFIDFASVYYSKILLFKEYASEMVLVEAKDKNYKIY